MFVLVCNSGMHRLHIELPQGNVTGSCKVYEHCAHCVNLTICRASFVASNGPVGEEGSDGGDGFEEVLCRENGGVKGRDDMGAGCDVEFHTRKEPPNFSIVIMNIQSFDRISQVKLCFPRLYFQSIHLFSMAKQIFAR